MKRFAIVYDDALNPAMFKYLVQRYKGRWIFKHFKYLDDNWKPASLTEVDDQELTNRWGNVEFLTEREYFAEIL
jgi:hypothetical protein